MLTVDRKALARALKIVGPAVAKTSHIPALFGVHLVAGESALHLTASNLDLTIGTVLDAEMDDEPFEVIASAATLGRILAAGRERDVHLAPNADGTMGIASGVTASMRTIAGTFPDVAQLGDDATEAELTAEDMEQIARVLHAVSLDTQRVRLCGIHLADQYAEATDSIRAARTTLSVELPDMLLPADVVRSVIEHAIAPVGVACDGKRAQFTSGPTSWITQLIPTVDEAFPDLTRLLAAIAGNCTTQVTVAAVDLIDLLDRLRSLAPVTASALTLAVTA